MRSQLFCAWADPVKNAPKARAARLAVSEFFIVFLRNAQWRSAMEINEKQSKRTVRMQGDQL